MERRSSEKRLPCGKFSKAHKSPLIVSLVLTATAPVAHWTAVSVALSISAYVMDWYFCLEMARRTLVRSIGVITLPQP